MADPVAQQRLLTVDEYRRFEDSSPEKHEYVAGRVFAMVGVTRRHARIVLNLARKLDAAAEGTPCRVSVGDVKLQAADEIFYYPDIIVARGPAPGDEYVEDAPCLLVEVVSPRTEATDRREKLAVYQRIPSLKAYLIVMQHEPKVERYWRDDSGAWHLEVFASAGTFSLPCPAADLSLREIYARLG